MDRRRFDFLYGELCVAIGRRLPRYDVWLVVSETLADSDPIGANAIASFIDGPLSAFLAERDIELTCRMRKRLSKRVTAFDPRYATPDEWLTRVGRAAA